MLAGSLNAEVRQATSQLLHFRSRPGSSPCPMEEIVKSQSRCIEKNIMLFSLKRDWLYMRPAECCFRLTSVCHSLPVTAASNARLQRQSKERPHLGIERWNYFLFARLFFVPRKLGGPFYCLSKMCESQIRCL
jgi:hypothetical protein